jgi:lysyl-tRNA synthetase class 2
MESRKNRLVEERKTKLHLWIEKEGNPYSARFTRQYSIQEVRGRYENLKAGEKTETEVSLAGRIVALRGHGKTSFADLKDKTGRIQIYARQDKLKKKYPLFEKLDIGDIIGVRGRVFKTKSGELTIETFDFLLLAKSLRPLPEKWHGLQDIELRYRKRYLDLLSNPEAREIFLQRGAVVNTVREFLNERGFLEVETPMMQPLPGGATARPFSTHHRALNEDLYLRIAPELYLKKLIVGGMEKVYELNRNFRNEGIDRLHNPEFTMLEVYSAYDGYEEMMKLTEELIQRVARQIKGTLKISYQREEVDLSSPWKRMTFEEALREIGNLEVNLKNEAGLRKVASEAGLNVEELTSAQILEHLLDRKVAGRLIQPTFIIDYPVETSPLAKRKKEDPSLIERFEVFIGGQEIGNAYSELNDPIEQRARFTEAEAGKGSVDEDFLEALEYGMPPTGGLGIGIDRLVMLLTNSVSIRQVILFPQLKSKPPEPTEEY